MVLRALNPYVVYTLTPKPSFKYSLCMLKSIPLHSRIVSDLCYQDPCTGPDWAHCTSLPPHSLPLPLTYLWLPALSNLGNRQERVSEPGLAHRRASVWQQWWWEMARQINPSLPSPLGQTSKPSECVCAQGSGIRISPQE